MSRLTLTKRSSVLLALGALTAVAWAPLAGVLLGTLLASALGCQVDESTVRPCVVSGLDVGPLLSFLLVSGWFMLAVWPLMALTLLAWPGVLIWVVVSRLRRQRP